MSLGGGPHISLGMVRDAESDPQPVDHRRTKQSILPRITAEIKTELYQRPSRTLIAWDAIGQDIYAKHVFKSRADGTHLPVEASPADGTPIPPRNRNTDQRDPQRRREHDRRDCGGADINSIYRQCLVSMRNRGGLGQVQFDKDKGTPYLTSTITHFSCNCGGADINSIYRQCLVSMRNSTTYFTALTLSDAGVYTLFVNREVAKWLELHQHGGTVAGAHHARSSRHDLTTSEVGLTGTQLSSSMYGTVVFDLTFF
jgi:hypothetical protein